MLSRSASPTSITFTPGCIPSPGLNTTRGCVSRPASFCESELGSGERWECRLHPLHLPSRFERVALAMRKSESKVEAEGENNSRVGPAGIEYVGCEVDFLVGEANEQTALDVKVSVVGLCPLGYKARATPVSRRVGQFHPAVEKTTRVVFCVEHIFAFGREFNPLPTERGQISRRKSGRGPKDTADHRGSFEDQFFTGTKVVTKPQRASLLVLIVVARSKVKPSAICRERRRGIGPVVRHDIAGDVESKRPLIC